MKISIKKKIYIPVLIISVLMISIVWADSNGIWHKAQDVRPGIFGEDEVLDFTQPPFFAFKYLFVGMIYDGDNPAYFVNPSSDTNLNKLEVEGGNVVNNCEVKTSLTYVGLSCDDGFEPHSMNYDNGEWSYMCCKVNN